jgi:CRISPR/Cas system-associated exonuclease Cas4 (RecB family)
MARWFGQARRTRIGSSNHNKPLAALIRIRCAWGAAEGQTAGVETPRPPFPALLVAATVMPMLSKSSYLRYLKCPRYMWLWEHRRQEVATPLDMASERRIEEGERVEELARTLFPNGRRVRSFHERGAERTRRFTEKGETCLFQATAFADGLLAMADVLQFNPDLDVWDIFEVKGSTSVKSPHLQDVTFQALAFEHAGYKIGKTSIIHINKSYVRRGPIDVAGFLAVTDVTARSVGLQDAVAASIVKAKAVLGLSAAPSIADFPCTCSPEDCLCASLCFPDLPRQSIFVLQRMTTKKARSHYEQGIRTLHDVPDELSLSAAQKNQVRAARNGAPMIDRAAIKRKLDSLPYPLYFLDYETFAASIPPFDDFKPYQVMPFQFSLHIMETPTAEPIHVDYLAPEFRNTIPDLCRSLRRSIGDSGAVVVWNKRFEMTRNDEMSKVSPDDAAFLASLNGRMFDLMDIFVDQLYVDVRFSGSCSIKDILPVLVPSLSYKELPIREGTGASVSWYRMCEPATTDEERTRTRNDLLEYCKLDTLAMVAILRCLTSLANAD